MKHIADSPLSTAIDMLNRLHEIETRYETLASDLALPEVIADLTRYTSVLKEYKRLTPLVTKYREYLARASEVSEAEHILDSSPDSELRALAQEQLNDSRICVESILEQLTVMLLPRDPNDDRNVIVEIRAGAGGDEAALFAAVMYRMYSMYCDKAGFSLSTVSTNETGLGGYREIVFTVDGDGAYSRFKFESGVHRVQRVPETESQGRIHTSTVTVAVLPEADEVEIDIPPTDIVFESCKSSGAGGQHINKTESAVRLTHKPTGIVVECQQERSQFQNKDKAMSLLRARLYDMKLTAQQNEISSARRSQVGSGDRSEKIRTYNYPQNRVTDHRIGLTLHSLDSYLDGNISMMIDSLIAADTADKLKNGS